jgi:hypothetical protein
LRTNKPGASTGTAQTLLENPTKISHAGLAALLDSTHALSGGADTDHIGEPGATRRRSDTGLLVQRYALGMAEDIVRIEGCLNPL